MRSDPQKNRAHVWVLWVVVISFALHATEEYLTGWQSWALQISGIAVPTSLFITANLIAVVAAIAIAWNGWNWPTVSLIVPAATLVNGIFLHLLPTVALRRVSPGLYTSIFLYLPFSSFAFVAAWRAHVSKRSIAKALILGVTLNCIVIICVWLISERQIKASL